MQLNDSLHVLPITLVRNGQTSVFNLSLILDPTHDSTLVDAGEQLRRVAQEFAP